MNWQNETRMTEPRKNISGSSGSDRDIFIWQIPQLVLVTTIFLLIVIGNGCVLLSLVYSENGRKTRMNFFIMHLAIADLLVGLLLVSQDIMEKLMIDFDGGSFLCKFLQFIKVVVLYASTYLLVSLSLDRLDAVARPMRFSRREFRAKMLITSAWVLSAVFSIPTLVLFDVSEGNVTYKGKSITLCEPLFSDKFESQIYMTLIAIAAFILPALIITVCYCVIIVVICRNDVDAQRERERCYWTFQRQESLLSNVTVESSRSNPCLGRSGNPIIERAKIRTVKMTFFIVSVFILCWCPYFGFMLYHVYEMGSPNTNTLKALTAIVQSLAPLNSAANPVIYGVFSTRICRNLRNVPLLKYVACCGGYRRRFGSRMSHTSQVEGFYLNDVSSLRRRQLSGPKWNSEPEHRHVHRGSRPLLHRSSSLLNGHHQKEAAPCELAARLSNDDKPRKGTPLLQRQLSEEDTEILRSYTAVKEGPAQC
uniref:Cardioacceleratory peptide receptor-like n=1 Tax=Crassostrea virginica TaxID=6565 RepID=A0A8B8D1J6_CRAVI|nr:cardioacceleratory peptide receptor-like [Crassostrea virginica]